MNPLVQQQLRNIITDFGHSICSEHARVEALLRDLCAPYRREVSVLASALKEGVATDLIAWQDTMPRDVAIARLAKRLEANQALTDVAALWAVETWELALLKNSVPEDNRWHEFSGSGQNITEPFTLKPGLAIFEATHKGTENFLVELFTGDGQYVELIFNEIGRSYATKPVGISCATNYYLATRARGDWAIDIRQPQPLVVEETPFVLRGAGQRSSPFVKLNDGKYEVAAEYVGIDNFTVTLLSGKGHYVDVLINEVGNCGVRRSFQPKIIDTYILDISSGGDWKITIT